ncbi:MAG UNVERIFIED_CONTAM: PhoD-like phosphatase N-terminal domain-containing protein [Anaerolineae bacterium]
MSSPLFQHGIASGDPLEDRVILWTRLTSAEYHCCRWITRWLPIQTLPLSLPKARWRPALASTIWDPLGRSARRRDPHL